LRTIEVFAADWLFTTQRASRRQVVPPDRARGRQHRPGRHFGSGQRLEKIEFMILQALGCAHTSVRVMTPYFLPDERIITALSLAAYRGVELTCRAEHSNHPTVDWARGCRWPAADSRLPRVDLPAPFNHSKLMSVDGVWALVAAPTGMCAAFRLNFELDLESINRPGPADRRVVTAHQGTRSARARSTGARFAAPARWGCAAAVPYL